MLLGSATLCITRIAIPCTNCAMQPSLQKRGWGLAVTVLLVMSLWANGAEEPVYIDFGKTTYTSAPGERFNVTVQLRSPLEGGLSSYGVKLLFPSTEAIVEKLTFLEPALNFNGPQGSPAITEFGPGFAAVKGTIDFFAQPMQYFSGTRIVEFEVLNLSSGEYALSLELYRTLGPTESIFVNGGGSVLDQRLVFGSATVVPEPGSIIVFLLAGAIASSRRILRRRTV